MTDWTPGDPLAPRGAHGGFLYNFRDDYADDETCNCGDAAHWTADPDTPLPTRARPISGDDELAVFIAEWCAWDQAGRPGLDGAA